MKIRTLLLFLLFLSISGTEAIAARFQQSARTVDRFDYVEVTLALDAPASGNPFVDASFTGDFTPPGAAVAGLDGFCDSDDGRVFRIRFMPMVAGKHHYEVRFRNGGTELKHAGDFTARIGKRPGVVRVDREHPTHFIFDGSGAHFFCNSTSAYWLLGFQDDAVIRESIDRLARLKVNRIRVALSDRTASGICAFRAANEPAFKAAFVSVLQMAQHLRLTQVGAVSVDGTKIHANASKHAAVSSARAGEMLEQLELEVKELLERARQAEAQEGQEPLDIPVELARREKRQAALQQARQVIEGRAKEMAAAQQEECQAQVAAPQAQRDAGKKPRGKEPVPPSEQPDPKAQYNFTDPESRIMKAGGGSHFEQACNAQAAVDEAMLIVGQRVCAAPNDKQQLVASVAAISPVVAAQVSAVLVDSGFYSAAAVRAVEENAVGTPSGVTVYAAVEKHSHHRTVADLLPQAASAAPGPEASAQEIMAHRLKTAAGQALYKLRKQTVEPVFGIIKEGMWFRRFLLRSRVKVALEWTLVCVSYNLKRLFTLKNLAAAG